MDNRETLGFILWEAWISGNHGLSYDDWAKSQTKETLDKLIKEKNGTEIK